MMQNLRLRSIIVLFFVNILVFCTSNESLFAQEVQDTTIVLGSEDTSQVADTDSTSEAEVKKRFEGFYQWRVGIDLARIGFNFLNPDKMGYDFQIDFRNNERRHWVAEAGYGRGKVDFDRLKYTTNTVYLKVGLDNAMLKPMNLRDFDIVFLGVRYAAAYGSRSEASYSFQSPFGGEYQGVEPGQDYFVHWGEVTIGMKLEIWKRIFLGWTARGRFLFNPGTFKEIAPNYIAGYGSGDNATSFDINLYLSYAFLRYKNVNEK